jgi:hypothetical protein
LVAVQLSVGLVDTPLAPLDGDGLEGLPGSGQAPEETPATIKGHKTMIKKDTVITNRRDILMNALLVLLTSKLRKISTLSCRLKANSFVKLMP